MCKNKKLIFYIPQIGFESLKNELDSFWINGSQKNSFIIYCDELVDTDSSVSANEAIESFAKKKAFDENLNFITCRHVTNLSALLADNTLGSNFFVYLRHSFKGRFDIVKEQITEELSRLERIQGIVHFDLINWVKKFEFKQFSDLFLSLIKWHQIQNATSNCHKIIFIATAYIDKNGASAFDSFIDEAVDIRNHIEFFGGIKSFHYHTNVEEFIERAKSPL
jgi:hypothetical protein